MFRASLLALTFAIVGCGSRVADQVATDGGVVDADASAPPPDTRPEFSCPSGPPIGDSTTCFEPDSTCSYPCGTPSETQTYRCLSGRWVPMNVCEPPPPAVGSPCSTNNECDVTGLGIDICTRGAFGGGSSLYPTPVCIGTTCEPGPGPLTTCERESGLCLRTSSGGICLPLCTFGNDGSPPKGCIGKNMCWPVARADSTSWWGYCFAGCTADADCPTGERCNLERLACEKTIVTPTKPIGAACDSTDVTTTARKCECIYSASTKLGYCSRVCRLGVTGCPTGYQCDPMMTDGDPAKLPAGIGGYCLKTCTSDADCVNSKCEHHAGMTMRTCSVERSL